MKQQPAVVSPTQIDRLVVLSIAPPVSQREAFDAASASWRTTYGGVIVEAATLGSEELRAHAGRVGDGVVIGVSDQRRVFPANRERPCLVRDLCASVIGVVMTAPISQTEAFRESRDRSRLKAAAQQ
jgi:hypothetical protein